MSASLDTIMPMFLAELFEQLGRLCETLLSLEGAGPTESQESLTGFMRDLHSIKGTGASFGFDEISRLAHALEDRMLAIEGARRGVQKQDADLVLEALDALRARGEAIQRHGRLTKEALERFEPLIAQLEAASRDVDAGSPDAIATVVELPLSPAPERPEPSLPQGEVDTSTTLGTVRITHRQIQELEKPVERLRQVRGRIARHRAPLTQLIRDLGTQYRESGDRRLREAQRVLQTLTRALVDDEAVLSAQVRELDEGLRTAQLVPLELLVESLRHGVLQQARRVGKKVRVEVRGGDLKIDRRIFDALKDPLVHLLRNAVDHGFETAERRMSLNKPEVGVLLLQAVQEPEVLRIEVSDDGAGIDLGRVRARALERGLHSAAEVEALTDEDARALIFRAGFSTAAELSETSGRGVGLDVVALAINRLSGCVDVQSEEGRGSRFSLLLPRSHTAERVFLVDLDGRSIGVKMSAVERMIRVRVADVKRVGGLPVLRVGEDDLNFVNLSEVLGFPSGARAATLQALVIRSEGQERRLAVQCGRILGVRDAVIRALPRELLGLRHLSGVADLGDGEVVFVFNESTLFSGESPPPGTDTTPKKIDVVTVLVVDDTVSTRALHRRMLEAAGYRVLAAGNGEEALRVLEAQPVHLVVTDVEMPELDGIGMLQRMRATPKLARIPAILVSSLTPDSRKGKRVPEGLADAYITKTDFAHGTLVTEVKRLIARVGL